jgi:hypothetical protein
MVIVPAAVAALALSAAVAGILNGIIRVDFASINNADKISSFFTGEADIVQNFQVSLRKGIIGGLLGALSAAGAVSSLLPLMVTLNLQPRNVVLANKRGA